MTDEKSREHDPAMRTVPMPMCPMGETCMRMMANPPSRMLMFLPGVVFIGVGVLIVVEPAAVIWLIAAALILMGLAMLGCAYFMRTVAGRMMRAQR